MSRSAEPVRGLEWKYVVFRMRHQAKDIALPVADPGYIQYRSVGVGRVGAIGRLSIRMGIYKRHLIIFKQVLR